MRPAAKKFAPFIKAYNENLAPLKNSIWIFKKYADDPSLVLVLVLVKCSLAQYFPHRGY